MRVRSAINDTVPFPTIKPVSNSGQADVVPLRSEETDQVVQPIPISNEPVMSEQKRNSSEEDVIKAIEKANKHIKIYDRKLEFAIHDLTKQIIVKVINTEDDTIIREIPSEKILDLVAHLWEISGILVDEKR